ncbi:LOW QUALITY PROTEIN: cationic amino acid transporter 4 [Glossophaga mutica]
MDGVCGAGREQGSQRAGRFAGVPMVSILVFGVLVAFTVLLLDLETLVQFLFIGTVLAYSFVATTVIVLCFRKFPPFSSPGPASSGLVAKEYSSFQNCPWLMGTEQASAPELRQLRPALMPYLVFLGGCSLGVPVAWARAVMAASAISLGCVLVFGDSAVHLPCWGYILLLLLNTTLLVLGLLILGAHQQPHKQDTFQTFLVPLTAALSILLNTCLMLKLSYLTGLCLSIRLLMASPHCVVSPHGSLEETVQVMQSQALALEPRFMEQPTSPRGQLEACLPSPTPSGGQRA